MHTSTFNRECQQVAAVLEQLNPSGETPKALRREQWYQEQERERRHTERVARTCHWFGLRVTGKRWDSLAQLAAACEALAVTLNGGPLDDETARVVTQAVTLLHAGRVEWALFREPRVVAEVVDGGVSFALAS